MSNINITDNPISNYDMLCNFCRYVDGRAKFLRTEAGDDTDIYDFCRNKCSEKCGVDFPEKDGGFMMEKMCFDCSETDCLIYLLYITAVQAAELREHIKNHNSDNGEPVCHGHWIKKLMSPKIGLYGYICSNCNKIIYVGKEKYMRYCGNCGAKMDGDEK